MSVDRRRRRGEEKKENHERWVISYADFMTLLLATFVVLYAISSINTTKYQLAAEALSAIFSGKIAIPHTGENSESHGLFDNQPAPVRVPVSRPTTRGKADVNTKTIHDGKVESRVQAKADKQIDGKVESKVQPDSVPAEVREQAAKLDETYKHLNSLLHDMIDRGQVHMAFQGLTVVIDISASVLFDSGKAELTPDALVAVDKIGGTLKDLPYHIQINGYTDNAPIHTAQFNSNWELSAMRAMSVLKRFVADGVDPTRLVGAGFGEYHPIGGNDTPEGMSRNRRVAVVVTPDDSPSPPAEDLDTLGKIDPLAVPPTAGAPATSSGPAAPATYAGPIQDRAGIPHLPLGTGAEPPRSTLPTPAAAPIPAASNTAPPAAVPPAEAVPPPASVPAAASAPPATGAAPAAKNNTVSSTPAAVPVAPAAGGSTPGVAPGIAR